MKQKGFSPIAIIIILAAIFVFAGANYYFVAIDNNRQIAEKEVAQDKIEPALTFEPTPIPTSTLMQPQESAIVDSFQKYTAAKPEQLTKIGPADEAATERLKKIFYGSPDGKYSVGTDETEGGTWTWITDIHGSAVTSKRAGSFLGWSPDGQKIILHPTDFQSAKNNIYFLTPDDKYYDSGLPTDSFSADISSKDGSIVYSDRPPQKPENSTIYIRNKQGENKLLIKGQDNILGGLRWSPGGNKIAFLRSEWKINKESIWVVNSDGTGLERISDFDWTYVRDYLLRWSPDGSKIIFLYGGYVWEYTVKNGK
jgi:Tol biopolymer transport system component